MDEFDLQSLLDMQEGYTQPTYDDSQIDYSALFGDSNFMSDYPTLSLESQDFGSYGDYSSSGSSLQDYINKYSAPREISYMPGSVADTLNMSSGDILPSSSYLSDQGSIIGLGSDADINNPYVYKSANVMGQDGRPVEQTFILDTDSNRVLGYLDDNNQAQYYSGDLSENTGALTQAGVAAGTIAGSRAGSSGGAASSKSAQAQLAEKLAQRQLNDMNAAERAKSSTLGQGLSAAKMLALMLQAGRDNPSSNISKRDSSVENTGPQFANKPNRRTLYAEGGEVELPEKVGGGLMQLALQIAKQLQGGGEDELGLIDGEEGGQDDVVDIVAAPGEYVFDAEIVSMLGDGNTKAGAKKLDDMRYNIRKHKRAGGLSQIAARAKHPEQYIGKGE